MREILGHCRGVGGAGGSSFFFKCPNFNLGILKNWGRGANLSKMSVFNVALRQHHNIEEKIAFFGIFFCKYDFSYVCPRVFTFFLL